MVFLNSMVCLLAKLTAFISKGSFRKCSWLVLVHLHKCCTSKTYTLCLLVMVHSRDDGKKDKGDIELHWQSLVTYRIFLKLIIYSSYSIFLEKMNYICFSYFLHKPCLPSLFILFHISFTFSSWAYTSKTA